MAKHKRHKQKSSFACALRAGVRRQLMRYRGRSGVTFHQAGFSLYPLDIGCQEKTAHRILRLASFCLQGMRSREEVRGELPPLASEDSHPMAASTRVARLSALHTTSLVKLLVLVANEMPVVAKERVRFLSHSRIGPAQGRRYRGESYVARSPCSWQAAPQIRVLFPGDVLQEFSLASRSLAEDRLWPWRQGSPPAGNLPHRRWKQPRPAAPGSNSSAYNSQHTLQPYLHSPQSEDADTLLRQIEHTASESSLDFLTQRCRR